MSEKIYKARQRERELLKRIEAAEEYKKKVIGISQGLLVQYRKRKISKDEYEEKLKEVLNGRDIQEWLDYYDNYIKSCNKYLDNCSKDIRKERAKIISLKVAPFVFIGLLIILILVGLFFVGFERKILLSPEDEAYLSEIIVRERASFFDEDSGNTFIVDFVQYGAVVGKEVQWEVIISSDEVAQLKAALPREAFDIEIISVEGAENISDNKV